MLQCAVYTTRTYFRLIIIGSVTRETMSWEEPFDEQNIPGLVDDYSISPVGHRAELGEEGREVRSGGVLPCGQPGWRKSTINTTHDMTSIRCQ